MSLRNKWAWNREYYMLFLSVPSVTGIALAIVLYPFVRLHSLWFLFSFLMGLMLYGTYKYVGSRVELLMKKHNSDNSEAVECLMVINNIESPGVVVLRESELELFSITGNSCLVPFSELKIKKEGKSLPGKYLWGKRTFMLNFPDKKRLGFGVPEAVGQRWSEVFSKIKN